MTTSAAQLGYLVWFSVHKTKEPVRLELARARELFQELELDPGFLPRTILPIHAFQAASSSTTSSYEDEITGASVELKVREIKRNNELHVRHVVRHAVSPTTKLSSTAMLIELKFIHARHTVKGRRPGGHEIRHLIAKYMNEATIGARDNSRTYKVNDQDQSMAEDWLRRFYAEYELLQTHLSADAIRAVVRDYLHHCSALLANSRGGVYFVPSAHADTIKALHTFVDGISEECRLHTVTLTDSPENQAMLRDIWQDTATETIERMNQEIEQLYKRATTKDGKVGLRSYINIKTQWDAAVRKTHEYAALTNVSASTVNKLMQPTTDAVAMLATAVR